MAFRTNSDRTPRRKTAVSTISSRRRTKSCFLKCTLIVSLRKAHDATERPAKFDQDQKGLNVPTGKPAAFRAMTAAEMMCVVRTPRICGYAHNQNSLIE